MLTLKLTITPDLDLICRSSAALAFDIWFSYLPELFASKKNISTN